MKLIDLKRSKKEMKKNRDIPETTNYEKYPYGLKIQLENETLEKFDIDISEFKIGQKIRVEGIAIVNSIRINQSMGDKAPRKNLSLQIIKLGLAEQEQESGKVSLRSLTQMAKK